MACRTVFRTVFLKEPWLPLPRNPTSFPVPLFYNHKSSLSVLRCRCKSPSYRRTQLLNCSNNGNPSSSEDDLEQGPPQEVVLKAISEVSKTEGRVGQTTNVVIGGTVHDDSTNEWLALDKKVNSYPTERGFTAIGTGGDDFVHSMVVAVESVIQQPVPQGRTRQAILRHKQVRSLYHENQVSTQRLKGQAQNSLFLLFGPGEAEAIFRGEICISKYRTHSSCFQ